MANNDLTTKLKYVSYTNSYLHLISQYMKMNLDTSFSILSRDVSEYEDKTRF